MWYRLIPAPWLKEQDKTVHPLEGDFSTEEIAEFNKLGYNIYFFPNTSTFFTPTQDHKYLTGDFIDVFSCVFVDMDLKDKKYENKQQFIDKLLAEEIKPTSIVDSGNGVHAYWKTVDLDPMSYLRLQRRLTRKFDTDEAVSKLAQLMRCPGTSNVKVKDDVKPCEVVYNMNGEYTSEMLNNWLPPITPEDEEYCKTHYNSAYNVEESTTKVSMELPPRFQKFVNENSEAKNLFYGNNKDRSVADYRLAHLMYMNKFKKEEAAAVLMNTAKSALRTPKHRISYAENIIKKVWIEEANSSNPNKYYRNALELLNERKAGKGDMSVRIQGHPMFDGTFHGFRLSEVLGLVAGSGVGKTTVSLNYFKWFVERNPDMIHVFVSLEQPVKEIEERWGKICQGNELLYGKVYFIGNYNEDGTHREISLKILEEQIKQLEHETATKVGCIVIDHIGILVPDNKKEERTAISKICKDVKTFAVRTNTFVIAQSQSSRAKVGIGDIEIDKDAAYGTTTFEWYCDYVVTLWQPLMRVYDLAANMKVVAFKFCKIRHKNVDKDILKQDQVYAMMFEGETENLRPLTLDEYNAYDYWNKQATSLRNRDKKREPAPIKRIGEDGQTL